MNIGEAMADRKLTGIVINRRECGPPGDHTCTVPDCPNRGVAREHGYPLCDSCRKRIDYGWPIERILNTPPQARKASS